MAVYHLSVQTVKRGEGRSAVAAAAYRSGQRLASDRLGLTFDYRGKGRRNVVARRLVGWGGTRAALWNAAEAAEQRRDAREAREVCVSLPHEVPAPVRRALVWEFAGFLRDRYRCAVDASVHLPGEHDARNHHAHLLMTTRTSDGDRLGQKVRALDAPATAAREVEAMRRAWADAVNAALEACGRVERVDHRSHARQGAPVESEHVDRGAAEVERRTGEATDQGDRVRARSRRNSRRRHAAALTAPERMPEPVAPEVRPHRRATRSATAPERDDTITRIRAALRARLPMPTPDCPPSTPVAGSTATRPQEAPTRPVPANPQGAAPIRRQRGQDAPARGRRR